MNTTYKFKTANEMFDDLDAKKFPVELATKMLESLSQAVEGGSKTSLLFVAEFEDIGTTFEVVLPSGDFLILAETLKEFFTRENQSDLAIESYLLTKKLT